MINRIRDVRKQKGMTLAEVAQRCKPPTTAQTIGRLETGTRNLSLVWMNRIAAALGVEPEALLRDKNEPVTNFVARLTAEGAAPLTQPTEAAMPRASGPMLALAVEASNGEFRAGDMIWLRQLDPQDFARALNRDCLVPRSAGRFTFGRMIDFQDEGGALRVAILPPGAGQRQIVVDRPPWVGVAEILVRSL